MRKLRNREVKVMHKDCKKAYIITESTPENKHTTEIFIPTCLRMFYVQSVQLKCINKQRFWDESLTSG